MYDSSGNERKIEKEIEVCDTVPPTLDLKLYYDTIYIEDEMTDNFFATYIKECKDDCKNVELKDVVIDSSNFKKEIGSYNIYYTLEDDAKNYSKRTLALNVSYKSAPTLTINEDNLIFEKNTSYDLNDYIVVTDLYDNDIENSIIIDDTTVDNSKAGNYEVIISVTNKAGNTTTKNVIVKITDKQNESKEKDFFYSIYDWIYENKFHIAFVIAIIIAIVIYFVFKKRKRKMGE